MILRLILGDQLNQSISSLRDAIPGEDLVMLCEVWEEAVYVRHHKKKIAFLFSAMRHFADELREQGHEVHYTTLDDPDNAGSFRGEVERITALHGIEKVIVTAPSEYRVLVDMQKWDMDVEIRHDDRFLCNRGFFEEWARGRKQLRMEYFYREMRKSYRVLMDGDQPEGGEWNYDQENRKPPKQGLDIPPPQINEPDAITQDVMALVAERFPDHFGDLDPFYFAVTREQAMAVLDRFIAQRLCHFGDYQDAMIQGEPWMYHSHISFYLNCGLLLPLEVIQLAEEAYRHGRAPLNAVEGFIRQILGWREYVRGLYWLKMPDYETMNFFKAKRDLPDFFWGAETGMNCLKQCVKETRENAYAHHIQRLMVLGNFALLAGLDPDQVNEWYLIVYADAYQWVELPNVTGMVLYADGGLLASKPYASSGAYINKMSDYCKNCRYKVSVKNGEEACPFNYLYWDFLVRNREKLASNPRMGMMFKSYDRMDEDKKKAITQDADRFLNSLS